MPNERRIILRFDATQEGPIELERVRGTRSFFPLQVLARIVECEALESGPQLAFGIHPTADERCWIGAVTSGDGLDFRDPAKFSQGSHADFRFDSPMSPSEPASNGDNVYAIVRTKAVATKCIMEVLISGYEL